MMRALSILSAFLVLLFSTATASAENYKILSIQHQIFKPYTLSLHGFKKGIMESDLKGRVKIVEYNAKGDLKALDTYVNGLQDSKDVSLIFSIGTHATKRVVKNIKTIPIVFTDLGSPEYSGVVSDWKSSGANYTGVETKNYVTLGINLLYELITFNSIGMIYLEGSPSHEGTINQVTQLSKDAGFQFTYKGFPLRDSQGKKYHIDVTRKNIKAALDEVVPKVDVFFVQISATFDKNFDLFFNSFKKFEVPSAGDPIYIKKGLVMGIGRDKEEFGKQCAGYAVDILKGTDPAALPMDVGQKFSISLNIRAATVVGYNPSIDILSAADEIHKEINLEN